MANVIILHPHELQTAAEESMEQIRTDRERVGSRLAPIFDYLLENLLSPELTVKKLKRDLGIRDNSFSIAFSSAVGSPPSVYITARRHEIAQRLLRDTQAPVWRIGEAVGFSSVQVFSRSYARWAGVRPQEARRAMRREGSQAKEPVTPARELLCARAWRGELTPDEVTRLIAELLEIYPPGRPPYGTSPALR